MSTLDVIVSATSGAVTTLVFRPTTSVDRDRASHLYGARQQRGGVITFRPEPQLALTILHPELFSEPVYASDACLSWLKNYNEELRNKARAISQVEDTTLPISWSASLRPSQRVATQWLINAERAILGFPVGTGKTLIGLTTSEVAGSKKVLIVAPAYIKSVWARHISTWTSSNYALIDGDRAKRQRELTAAVEGGVQYVIVNYEMLQAFPGRTKEESMGGTGLYASLKRQTPVPVLYPELWRVRWDMVIFDEAHKLQGRKSLQSAGASKLNAQRLVLATGTPIWNRPDNIWKLLNIIDPKRFSSYWTFVETYCEIHNLPWDQFAREVGPIKPEALESFKLLLAQYLYRKDRSELLPELPAVTREFMHYDLNTTQRRAYEQIKKHQVLDLPDGRKKFYDGPAQAMHDLRMICAAPSLLGFKCESPKDKLLLELLANTLETTDRVVIFTWHKDYTYYLRDLIEAKLKVKAVTVTGDISAAKRPAIIQDFQDGRVPVLICTIASTGMGVDLQSGYVGIVAECDYVPTNNTQMEGRLDRIGQKNSPIFYHIHGRDTIEELIWSVTEEQHELNSEALALQAIHEKLTNS